MPGLCDIKTPRETEIFNMNTDSESQQKDSDLWKSGSTGDGLRNGDLCSSSLAAKGYRSIRLNFQEKKSPTPPEVPLLKRNYPGTSQSLPNQPQVSPDFISCRVSDLHHKTPSPGPSSPGAELLLGQSRCSSRTQSEASTALLEELRACGFGTEGGSRTPSPTLSQTSAVTENMGVYSSAASTINVTICSSTLFFFFISVLQMSFGFLLQTTKFKGAIF